MPFIHVRTNVNADKNIRSSLEAQFGKAISILPGKSVDWLRTRIEDNCHRTFAGSDEPTARIKVLAYGKASPKDYNLLTGKLTEIVSSLLPVSKERVYVSYFETPHWGFDGSDF